MQFLEVKSFAISLRTSIDDLDIGPPRIGTEEPDTKHAKSKRRLRRQRHELQLLSDAGATCGLAIVIHRPRPAPKCLLIAPINATRLENIEPPVYWEPSNGGFDITGLMLRSQQKGVLCQRIEPNRLW
jgi:hypothetical protein